MTKQTSMEIFEISLLEINASPKDVGRLDMIVRRPADDAREVVSAGSLDTDLGLVGDNWKTRGSNKTPDGSANPEAQITLMNSRLITAIAGDESRWGLAGDQLYVDFDLGEENLPPGSRISIGSALLEITALPHKGCLKFKERFGADALKFVSSVEAMRMRLRGVYAKVVQEGDIQVGDEIRKA
jgi:MOSC domain-containing protein YiiM